jgi:hypothetical protein
VTEPGDVLLDRVQLERAFTALGERLVRRGVVADVFVVGGAAMALAYDATRVTRDVDSLFVPHGVVLEEARNMARDLGLPAWWLNEQASVYISGAAYSTIPACGSPRRYHRGGFRRDGPPDMRGVLPRRTRPS